MRRIAIILNAMTQLLGALLCVTLNSNESPRRAQPCVAALTSGARSSTPFSSGRTITAFRRQGRNRRLPGTIAGIWVRYRAARAAGGTSAQAVKANTETRIPTAAEIEEATLDDPMSPDFNVIAWFARLPYEAKRRIVEWGVSIRMSTPNRVKAYNIAQAWWQADGKPREGHGMVEE
jgi:hypothetical protein